jgi:hypothetical protein
MKNKNLKLLKLYNQIRMVKTPKHYIILPRRKFYIGIDGCDLHYEATRQLYDDSVTFVLSKMSIPFPKYETSQISTRCGFRRFKRYCKRLGYENVVEACQITLEQLILEGL